MPSVCILCQQLEVSLVEFSFYNKCHLFISVWQCYRGLLKDF